MHKERKVEQPNKIIGEIPINESTIIVDADVTIVPYLKEVVPACFKGDVYIKGFLFNSIYSTDHTKTLWGRNVFLGSEIEKHSLIVNGNLICLEDIKLDYLQVNGALYTEKNIEVRKSLLVTDFIECQGEMNIKEAVIMGSCFAKKISAYEEKAKIWTGGKIECCEFDNCNVASYQLV